MCLKKLVVISLLFFLVLAVSCFSLSEEEIQVLPELDKQVLIQIIKELDEGLKQADKDFLSLEILMNEEKLEIEEEQKEIINDRKLLNEEKTELKLQTSLFLISSQMQENLNKKILQNRIMEGAICLVVGVISGYVSGRLDN